MGGNTKALRLRIKSVSSTLQLTKAMGLVASSKIRRANNAMIKARQYTDALQKSIALLTKSPESLKSPYMRETENPKLRIIVIAGDRGLAGGYNSNVFKLCALFPQAEFIPFGKRACDRFRKPVISSEYYSNEDIINLADSLCSDFAEQKFDKLGIIYTKYESAMVQTAEVKWVLPLEKFEDRKQNADIIFEPDHITVLNNVIREYVSGILFWCLRESFASEVAARKMAMDSAGKNAKEMTDDLKLQYNRARQGAITQEITEIVAGSNS
ncbi:MAG: F0F1 ATP synthase subunit gamma [Acutalibacteraceae bacterium]|jgi:F-type H+-transporting ATPase subunit gamma